MIDKNNTNNKNKENGNNNKNEKNDFDESISYKIPISERVGRNSLFNLGGNIISYILRFISIPIILAIIGFDMGYYYTITSYAAIIILFDGLFSLGVDFSCSKFISEYFAKKDMEKINTVYSITLFLDIISSIIASILMTVIFFVFIPSQNLIDPTFMNIYVISCITLIIGRFILKIVFIYGYILSGFQRQDFYVFLFTLDNIATVIFKLVFVMLGLNVFGLILADYLFVIIRCIVIYYLIKNKFKGLKFNLKYVKWKNIKKYSGQGLAFYFASWDEKFFIDLNTILIPYLLPFKKSDVNPNKSITIYGICLKLSRYGMTLTSSLQGGQVAVITELYTKAQYEKLKDLFSRLFNISFFISFVLATAVSLLSPQILLHYVGSVYYNSWPILTALSFMYAIKLSVNICRNILQSMNLTHKWTYIAIIEYILIVLFSIFGFIFFGLNGMAFGVLIAVLIYAFTFLYYTSYKINYSLKKLTFKISKIIIATSIPSIILLILLFNGLIPFSQTEGFVYLVFDGLIIMAFSALCLLIFYLLKGFHKKDFDVLKRSINNILKSAKRRTIEPIKKIKNKNRN
ncbi:MAG: oligosaccharide flippase family protein [Candidatus Helarchaeota archaeon]